MSNNRFLRTSLFRGNSLTAMAAGLLGVLLVILRMRLWRLDLTVPVSYWADALYHTVLVKALAEGTWNYHIARLGAPFGWDAVDFPLGATLDFAVIKILTAIVHNPFLSINLYWLLTIVMAGAFAALFFRSLQISHLASASFAALFAITPYVFYRNIGQLTLQQFIVPAVAYLGIGLARGNVFGISESNRPSERPDTPRRIFLVRLAICVAIGLTYIYWAFFACIVIAIGCLIGLFRFGNKKIVLAALLYITIIGAASVADKSGSLLYWYRNGYNRALQFKTPVEADIYGLRIRQMLTPIADHPFPLMRNVRAKIAAAGFPDDANGSRFAALGTIGAIGFVILCCVAVGRPRGRILGDARLRLLSGFVIALVLIAHVGGLGSLFNVFVVHEFRAYSRISPFIALFSLAAVAIAIDALLAGGKRYLHWLLGGCLLIFGAFDQIPVTELSMQPNGGGLFYEDQFFISQLESRLPSGTMVFQLPHTVFPLDAGGQRMRPFDQARAYLHSKTLRWSWGAMTGRNHDWAKVTAELPLHEFIERIIFAGFGGLLIDRYGYKDSEFEQSVLNYLGPASKFDLGRRWRWVFFDLRAFRERLESSLSSEERARREEVAKLTVRIEWLPSFSFLENPRGRRWRWCGRNGTIRFVNDSSGRRLIDVTGKLQQFSPGSFNLFAERKGQLRQFVLSADPVEFHDRFVLKPHSSGEIRMRFDGPLLIAPGDMRELAFQAIDFQWEEWKQ
jgi:phosphoglycerol transferase